MGQTFTKGFSTQTKDFASIALRIFMILALSGTTLSYAQQSLQNDSKFSASQTGINERNPGNGIKQSSIIAAQICPVLTGLSMLDMGFDKAILTWNNTAVFDSILFRFGPTGSPVTREVGIRGNPNPDRYFLMGLLSQTSYDIEVSTVCPITGRSAWSAPITVLTLAEPTPRLTTPTNNNTVITINPNPASTLTNISFKATNGTLQQVSILSSTGMLVYSKTLIPNTDKVQLTVDVTTFNPGIYMVRVQNGSGITVERLVKL